MKNAKLLTGVFHSVLYKCLIFACAGAALSGCGQLRSASANGNPAANTDSGNPANTESGKFLELQNYMEELAPQYVGSGNNADNKPKYPSMVLVMVTPDTSKILSFGQLQSGRAPTGTDIYPISSMSKMLTGLILAQGVVNGDFNLNASLKSIINVNSPIISGLKTETLGQTIAHFASFKKDPTNMNVNSQSPYAPAERYDYASLASALSQDSVSRTAAPIGSEYLYSDLGVALVGLGLIDFYRIPRGLNIPFAQSYGALLNRDGGLVKDLGLKNTRPFAIDDGDSTNPQIVRGLTQDNISVPASDMGVLGAAGSVLTNGEDMLKLLTMLLRPQGQWVQVVNEATRVLYNIAANQGTPAYAIGYTISVVPRNGMTLYTKSGEQAGFSSLIIWNKVSGVGFVALTNRGEDSESLAKMLIAAHTKAAEIYGN